MIIATLALLFLTCSIRNVSAQQRFKLTSDVTLVSYGNTFWLEDDKNQMSISISVAQEVIDHRNNQIAYNVVCEGSSKTVAKWTVKKVVETFIRVKGGTKEIASAAGMASNIVYDELCEYWGDSFE